MIGAADETECGADGSRECTFDVAEELRFHELGREDRAVDGDEGLIGARAECVNAAGGDFFANAGFTFDEDGGRARRDEFQLGLEIGRGKNLASALADAPSSFTVV